MSNRKAEWEEKSLGEILQLEYGKPLAKTDRKTNGRFPVYGANGEKDRTDKFYHDKLSIIVGRKGSAGELNLTEKKFWPLDVTYFVTFDERQYDLRFLYYLLTTLNLPKLADGVKPGINRNKVYSQKVNVPLLPEQQRIVAVLDKAFAAIGKAKKNTEKNLQNARELFESKLQDIFTQSSERWIKKPLGELVTFRNGINFTKSSRGEKVKIIGVKDFQQNFWAPMDDLDIATIDGKLPESDRLRENDFLFVRSNGNIALIGRCMLIGRISEKISYSGFTIRARLNDNSIMPQYLCHFLKSKNARRAMALDGDKANIKSLNQTTLSGLTISYPSSTSKQAVIVEILESLSTKTKRLETNYYQKLTKLDALRKSVLKKAFVWEL